MPDTGARTAPTSERDLVFNLVWTGDVYQYLRYFVDTQLVYSDARFRFIANACTTRSIEQMRAAADAEERIVEVMVVSEEKMIGHGKALQIVFEQRHDGEFFSLIDTDIKANGPFVMDLARNLERCDVITAGTEVWSDTNVIPDWQIGVSGEYFFGRDGFVFGSPHFSIYRRSALEDLFARRPEIQFNTPGEMGMSAESWKTLEDFGQDFWVYDTAKVVNILLQADGYLIEHTEHPELVHIGGLSHFLSPPEKGNEEGTMVDGDAGDPTWVEHEHMASRAEVAGFTARMLVDLVRGRAPAPVPDSTEPFMRERLDRVRHELIDMVRRPSLVPVHVPRDAGLPVHSTADRSRPYFFVHVMKTAGTTLNRHVAANFSRDEIYPGAADETGTDYWVLGKLRRAIDEDDGSIGIWTGHFPAFVVDLVPDAVSITVLREPVARIISLLRDYQRGDMKEMSIEQIYDDPEVFERTVHNHQTKVFSTTEADGVAAWADPIDVGEKRLAAAKSRLSSFDVVGVQEQFGDVLGCLEHRWGWTIEDLDPARVGDAAPDVSDAFRRRIATDNELDLELYAHAVDIRSRPEAGPAGSRLTRFLRRFR